MVRLLTFLLILVSCVCGELLIENRLVRRDQNMMKDAYADFLAKKAGGRTLAELIRPETLAVFRSPRGVVGCSIFKGE